jgi:hypothetical protein
MLLASDAITLNYLSRFLAGGRRVVIRSPLCHPLQRLKTTPMHNKRDNSGTGLVICAIAVPIFLISLLL